MLCARVCVWWWGEGGGRAHALLLQWALQEDECRRACACVHLRSHACVRPCRTHLPTRPAHAPPSPCPPPRARSKYVSEHGGNTNAYTAAESTNYHFDVNWEALPEALDRCEGWGGVGGVLA